MDGRSWARIFDRDRDSYSDRVRDREKVINIARYRGKDSLIEIALVTEKVAKKEI